MKEDTTYLEDENYNEFEYEESELDKKYARKWEKKRIRQVLRIQRNLNSFVEILKSPYAPRRKFDSKNPYDRFSFENIWKDKWYCQRGYCSISGECYFP